MVDTLITLYSFDATTFDNMGIGQLSDALTCSVEENLNGAFELTMTYPITGRHYSDIAYSKLIRVKPNPYDNLQVFRIYYISKPINGTITIKAQHVSYDLSSYLVKPFDVSALHQTMSISLLWTYIGMNLVRTGTTLTPFTISTSVSRERSFINDSVRSVRAILGGDGTTLISAYDVDLKFDNFEVVALNRRGTDRGVSIKYGVNMTGITEEVNWENVYTKIYPYYVSETYGIIDLLSTDNVWTTFTGTSFVAGTTYYEKVGSTYVATSDTVPVEGKTYYYMVAEPSPYTSALMDVPNSQGWHHNFRELVYPYDISSVWNNPYEYPDQYPSVDEIHEIGEAFLADNNLATPNVNLTIQFEPLAKTSEYANYLWLDHIELGDTVKAVHDKLGIESSLRCIKTVYNVLTDKYDTIELGDPAATLASNLSNQTTLNGAVRSIVTKQSNEIAKINTDFQNTNVLKDSDSYLYRTKLKNDAEAGNILNKISSAYLHADNQLQVINGGSANITPRDNGDDTYTYTLSMKVGNITVPSAQWSWCVREQFGESLLLYNLPLSTDILIPVEVTSKEERLLGIIDTELSYFTASVSTWTTDRYRQDYNSTCVPCDYFEIYKPLEQNKVKKLYHSSSTASNTQYTLTSPVIGQSFPVILERMDTETPIEIGTVTINSIDIGGYFEDDIHANGTLTLNSNYKANSGMSSYSWDSEVDVALWLTPAINYGNYIIGNLPNFHDVGFVWSGREATETYEKTISPDGLGFINNDQSDSDLVALYNKYESTGKYVVINENVIDDDISLAHIMISGSGNTINHTNNDPSYIDIVGNDNVVENCESDSRVVILGSNNNTSSFYTLGNYRMNGLFIGQSGSGFMFCGDTNEVKYFVNYVEQDFGVTYEISKSQDGTQIILTGSDGSVQTITDKDTIYDDTEIQTAIQNIIASFSNYYTKTEIDNTIDILETSIQNVINSLSNYYTKDEIDILLAAIWAVLGDDEGFASYQDEQDSIEEIFGTVYFITESGVRLQTENAEDIVLG